jgi:hypothetical protein
VPNVTAGLGAPQGLKSKVERAWASAPWNRNFASYRGERCFWRPWPAPCSMVSSRESSDRLAVSASLRKAGTANRARALPARLGVFTAYHGGVRRRPSAWSGSMNDNVENLILEQLKAIRADLGDLRREVREVKSRLASLEGQVVQMHKSVAFIHEDLAGMNARIDGLSDRVERIERRLDLREAV